MRKLISFGFALLMGMTFMACSSDEDQANSFLMQGDLVSPMPVIDSSISEFFETEWPSQSYGVGNFNLGLKETACRLINSKEQLQSIYVGDKELPVIDFVHYTLLMGQVQVPHSGHTIQKTDLVQTADGLEVNAYIHVLSSGYAVLTELYFWKLYPKLTSNNNIKINVIKTTQY